MKMNDDLTADLPAPDVEIPAPVPSPGEVMKAKLLAARDKAAAAKKRLMMDELADAVCEAIDAITASIG
jgi:hypothetical protein